MKPRTAIAMLVLLAAGLAAGAPPARAQSETDGAGLLAAGAKALEKGQHQEAARRLSRAMRSDELAPEQIAKALYLRGVAKRRMDRPGRAIADLTSALWLEGLSEEERARAYLNRGRAYEAVGMGDAAKADLRRAGADGADEAPAAASEPQGEAEPARTAASGAEPEAPARAPRPQAERRSAQPVRLPGFPSPIGGQRQPPSPPAREETAAAPTEGNDEKEAETGSVPAFRTSIQPEETAGRRDGGGETAAASAESGESTPWGSSRQAGQREREDPSGTLTGFFGGLWKSATGGEEEEETAGREDGRAPLASQWTRSTKVDRTSTAASAPAASANPASGDTIYHVQLAAVRSESDARAAWERLASEHESLLSGRDPVIRKSETGASGTLYRVQIGPFADKTESARLCNAFKNEGVDCFLVAR